MPIRLKISVLNRIDMAYARIDGMVDITFAKGKGQLGKVDGVRDFTHAPRIYSNHRHR